MKKNRLAVNLYFLVNGFLYANWVSRLPKFQELYEMNNSQTGMALLAIAIGAWLAMPITGWIIVKYGSQKVTAFAAIFFTILVPFIPLMGSIPLLVSLFFIMGISTGLMDVAMNAQAVIVEELYKRPIMSSFHAVFSGGMMIGAGTGALFTKLDSSLFVHLLIITIISLIFVFWSAFHLVPDQPEKVAIENKNESAFRMPTKELLGIGVIAFCCMLGEGAMADWSTNYMKNIAFSDEALAPIGLGAFSTAMMIGRIFGDQGRMRYGDGKLLIMNSLVALVGVLVLVLFPVPIVVIISLFLIGLGLSVIVPIAYSRAGAMKELGAGVGISMVTTIGYGGFLFGPPIIGFIADWQTLRIAMVFVGILFVIMTMISFGQWRRSRKEVRGLINEPKKLTKK